MSVEAVSHADILTAVKELTVTVGREFHDPSTGQLTATGLFARLGGVESRVQQMDQQDELRRLRWTNRIWGVTATAGLAAAVVMWFAGDRIDNAKEMIRKAPVAEAKK